MITHSAVEIIENAGIITSDLAFKFNDLIAISSAAVPLETAIPYFLVLYLEKFFSKSLTNLPSEEIQFVLIHFNTLYFSSLYKWN